MEKDNLYDFYYSRRHIAHLKTCPPFTKCEVFIDGSWQEYTEAIAHGKEPASKHFGDLVLITTMSWDVRLIRVTDLRRRKNYGK